MCSETEALRTTFRETTAINQKRSREHEAAIAAAMERVDAIKAEEKKQYERSHRSSPVPDAIPKELRDRMRGPKNFLRFLFGK